MSSSLKASWLLALTGMAELVSFTRSHTGFRALSGQGGAELLAGLQSTEERRSTPMCKFSTQAAILNRLSGEVTGSAQQKKQEEGEEDNIGTTMNRRLLKELDEMRNVGAKHFRNIQVDETNLLNWQGLLVPDTAPYDKGAFRIELIFPAEYPFKPPKVTFKTKIYHPNIDEKGQVCLAIISVENWKPATKTDQVIHNLVSLVNSPQPEHPLRADLAEEYSKDRAKFMKNAEEFTKKHSEKRPVD
ncbi:hypothetical protein F7725_015711 [Dissostichus mawsoni]|uniref:E2 ubiquitin-conjugating enzyme n=1 Tax=Dissostichus mawsoni TaxID=36200 RepID=A0A7J5YIB9_DISMA|nr:hypothetical protein F7725_015711 [Dissostichus mawsoni]